jgi:abhydrolase domain-containing protein 1/3
MRSFVRKRVPTLKERYWITPWAWEGSVHTVLASFFGELWPFGPRPVEYSRELLTLKDGGQVALDWKHKCGGARSDHQQEEILDQESGDNECLAAGCGRHRSQHPVVLILPGITGSSTEFYARSLVHNLGDAGLCCVVFNNRGLGGVGLKVWTENKIHVFQNVSIFSSNPSFWISICSLCAFISSKYQLQYKL